MRGVSADVETKACRRSSQVNALRSAGITAGAFTSTFLSRTLFSSAENFAYALQAIPQQILRLRDPALLPDAYPTTMLHGLPEHGSHIPIGATPQCLATKLTAASSFATFRIPVMIFLVCSSEGIFVPLTYCESRV